MDEGVRGLRAGLYARVSTTHQDVGVQLDELRRVAVQRGWSVQAEYIDEGVSGAKQSRPELDRLMRAARSGDLDIVAVARFDRFGRSVVHLLAALEEFDRLGVAFVSVHEALDTAAPSGRLLFALIGALGQFERELLRERVRGGVARARRQGKALGRPRRDDLDLDRAKRLLSTGRSVAAVAKMLDVPRGTLRSALARGGENRTPSDRVATAASC